MKAILSSGWEADKSVGLIVPCEITFEGIHYESDRALRNLFTFRIDWGSGGTSGLSLDLNNDEERQFAEMLVKSAKQHMWEQVKKKPIYLLDIDHGNCPNIIGCSEFPSPIKWYWRNGGSTEMWLWQRGDDIPESALAGRVRQ